MSKEPSVDYQSAVTNYSEVNRIGKDEPVVLPEHTGMPVVDYEAVAEKWKEEKGRMYRADQEEKNRGIEH